MKYDMNNSTSNDIKGPICKKVFLIGDNPPVMVAVLHEDIAKQLHIDENTWFEEIATSDGILLKISRCSESLALHRETSEDRGIRSK
jgi:hypothetical protein